MIAWLLVAVCAFWAGVWMVGDITKSQWSTLSTPWPLPAVLFALAAKCAREAFRPPTNDDTER